MSNMDCGEALPWHRTQLHLVHKNCKELGKLSSGVTSSQGLVVMGGCSPVKEPAIIQPA